MSRYYPSILFGLGVPLLLLVILIEIIWFSCITLFGGGNDGSGKAAIRSGASLPSPFQPNDQGQLRREEKA
jgi:hypothetical protein